MSNSKENKLDQIKEDLTKIQNQAESIHKVKTAKTQTKEKSVEKMSDDTLVLTNILEKGEKTNLNLSNNEIILKLKDIRSIMDIQNKILTDLINKLS